MTLYARGSRTFDAVAFMEPVAKERPRTTIKDGQARTYTPLATVEAEELLPKMLWQEWKAQGMPFFERPIPLSMNLDFYDWRPKSVKRIYPTARKDLDNEVKLVMDALQHFLYDNDSQVVSLTAAKHYCAVGELPRIHIQVRALE